MLKRLFLWTICLLPGIIFYACNPATYSSVSMTPTPNHKYELVPVEIAEFHIQHLSNATLVLTIYETPYSGNFRVILLKKDRTFLSWVDVPNFAVKSILEGTVNELEENKIIDELYVINHSETGSDVYGSYMIMLTTNLISGPNVLTCNENNCPKEICAIFETWDQVAQRQELHSDGKILCPIQTK
jgi:hypothetical protein